MQQERTKRVTEGQRVPPAPKQKRLDRRRERKTVRTLIHQYVGCSPADVPREEADK